MAGPKQSSAPRSLAILYLFRQRIHLKISLRRNTERVSNAIEERKHGRYINGLSDLRLCPSMFTEQLHVFRSGAIRRLGHLRNIVQERSLSFAQARFVQLAFGNGLYRFFLCSLNPQEVCMRVQSIWTAVKPRNPACDRFLGPAAKVAFGEVNSIAKAHDIPQKIRPMTEAFKNPGHILPS